MEFLNIVTIEKALEILSSITKLSWKKQQTVDVAKSVGYCLAEDICASVALPPYSRSTVDGYAVRATDTFGATESASTLLQLCGEIKMGKLATCNVSSGETTYIPTGGMLPQGADAVVMKEYCGNIGGRWISVERAVAVGENVVYKGEDVQLNEVVLHRGAVITPNAVALMASLGKDKVVVQKKPKIAVISTGDELCNPGMALEEANIYDSNTAAICALCTAHNMEVVSAELVQDSLDCLSKAIDKATKHADMVIVSGGSSAGKSDYTIRAIEAQEDGHVHAHGLAAKPGKPTIIGQVGYIPVVGLPGHPTAAIMIFHEVIVQYWKAQRDEWEHKKTFVVRMTEDVHASPGRQVMLLVRLQQRENELWAEPIYSKSAHIRTLSMADGYVKISAEQEGLQRGQLAEFVWF